MLVVALVLTAGPLVAQTTEAFGTPSDRYNLDQHFFKLPQDRPIGSTAGIAIDLERESFWVFDRCGADDCVGSDLAPILNFDFSGKLLRSFGAGLFVRPHGIHVDSDGNVYGSLTGGMALRKYSLK